LFKPRDGYDFVEADYSQLEVVTFAFICGDAQLIDDIMEGVDIHDKLGHTVYGGAFAPPLRRIIKGVVFGTIYGGGVETIAKQSGINEKIVWEVQQAFYTRYPGIKIYRRHMQKYLSGQAAKARTTYVPIDSVTGRVYNIPFMSKPSRYGMTYEPHFTKMCNYPVQGLATGDIVPMMLAHIEKWIRTSEDADVRTIRLINTVHDSILFEVPTGVAPILARKIKEQLESAASVFERVFRVRFPLPLTVNVKYGSKSWAELDHSIAND
jgi:DNA polymerase-1